MTDVDTEKWSGEGTFTQTLLDELGQLAQVALIRVEDAPASRSDADYNFISNEVFVRFSSVLHTEKSRRFGVFPVSRQVEAKALTVSGLEQVLAANERIGPPDYSDDTMLQYLKTERIIPPYQTRGYKLVELVRVYAMP